MENSQSLKSVENDLSLYIVFATSVVFTLSLLGHILIQKLHTDSIKTAAQNELESALHIYTSNLVNRIGVMASATEFMEFIRSGKLTRQALRKEFIGLMSRMPKQEIRGWIITNKSQEIVFRFGETTENHIKIKLCYLGDTLNAEFGTCSGTLSIYVSPKIIERELKEINSRITICDECAPITQLPSINDAVYGLESNVKLHITIQPDFHSRYFVSLIAISLLGLVFAAIWVRSRMKSVLYKKIIDPIIGISSDPSHSDYDQSTVQEIVDLRYKKELLQTKAYAEEAQNRTLANEIHDIFGPHLVSLKWCIERMETAENQSEIQEAMENIDELMKMTNNFIETLRPEVLDTLGLSRSIHLLMDEWQDKNNHCQYVATVSVDEKAIPEAVSHAIYRIAQEALTNIFKHAGATQVSLVLKSTELALGKQLEFRIMDNGCGFNYYSRNRPCGHGLNSMRERSVSLGGTFEVHSVPHKLTEIVVTFPLDQRHL